MRNWLLLIFIVCGHFIFAQIPPSNMNNIMQVCFTDAKTGFCIGTSYNNIGVVFKTINGGMYWNEKLSVLNSYFVSVYFLDKNYGWLVGVSDGAGVVYETKNGGETWEKKLALPFGVYTIFMTDQNNGFIGGERDVNDNFAGTIYRTTDGWKTYQRLPALLAGGISSIVFTDKKHGWIASGDQAIAYSTDGGTTWKYSFTTGGVNSLYFINNKIGWAATGSGGRILKTTDGGINWLVKSEFPSAIISSIHFREENTGWAIANLGSSKSYAIKTIDGGEKWFWTHLASGSANSIFYSDENTAWVGTGNGRLFHSQDGGSLWSCYEKFVPRTDYYTALYNVTNLNSSGPGSLVYAIENSVNNSTIIIDSALSGVITQTSSIYIDKNLTIIGPGADRLKVKIPIINNGILRLSGLTFSNYQFQNSDTLYISDCVFTESNQGGIVNYNCSRIENSLFYNNTTNGYGAGFYNYGNAELINCTFDKNIAYSPSGSRWFPGGPGGGGAIANAGNINMANCTIVRNQTFRSFSSYAGDVKGGGIRNLSGNINITNCIVAGNTVFYGDDPDISGKVNLIGNNIISVEPFVDTLKFNGGRIKTAALLENSPARGKGTRLDSIWFDQRGFLRDTLFDIGAYQSNTYRPYEILSFTPGISSDTFSIKWSVKEDYFISAYKIYDKDVLIKEIKNTISYDSVKSYLFEQKISNSGIYNYKFYAVLFDGREKLVYEMPVTFNMKKIDLKSMTVENKMEYLLLNWSTAYEDGVKGFEIYRNDTLISFKNANGFSLTTSNYSFMDYETFTGSRNYKITALFVDGAKTEFAPVMLVVKKNFGLVKVTEYNLSQNYPNPFNPATVIQYSIPSESKVELKVYNTLGQVIKVLVDDIKQAGIHEERFNANNLASGVYFYTISAKATNGSKEFRDVKKLLFIK